MSTPTPAVQPTPCLHSRLADALRAQVAISGTVKAAARALGISPTTASRLLGGAA